MEVKIKKINKLKHKLDIELKGEEFQQKKSDFYQKAIQKIKIPGFRPGKAPVELVEKHHKKALQESFIEKQLPLIYQEVIEKNNILPVGLPKISEIKMTSDFLSFAAEIEIQPEINLDDTAYKGMKIKQQKITVDTKQVENTLKSFKEEAEKAANCTLSPEKLAKWAAYPDIGLFKEAITAQIKLENLRQRKISIENQIKDNLLKSVEIDVPEAEVDSYQKQLLSHQLEQLQRQGISQDDLKKHQKDLQDKIKPLAENEIKFYYILKAIAKKEKITLGKQMANAVIGFILSEANFI